MLIFCDYSIYYIKLCHSSPLLCDSDLKPQNLLISEVGELKLADFGKYIVLDLSWWQLEQKSPNNVRNSSVVKNIQVCAEFDSCNWINLSRLLPSDSVVLVLVVNHNQMFCIFLFLILILSFNVDNSKNLSLILCISKAKISAKSHKESTSLTTAMVDPKFMICQF